MKYLTLILEIISGIKSFAEFVSNLVAKKKRTDEKEKIDSLQKEIKENLEKGEIDKINEKLKL